MSDAVGKKDLVSRVSVRYHDGLPKYVVPMKVLTKLFDLFLDEIFRAVANGDSVMINGFGSFHSCVHKGHPVQFGGDDSVEDYLVFKFTPSKTINKKLRRESKH